MCVATDPLYNCDNPTLLRKIAADLEQRARIYRDRADEIDQIRERRQGAQNTVALALSCPTLIVTHLEAGMSLDQAISATSHETALPLDTVRYHWQRWTKDRRTEQTQQRTRLVLQYAAKGYSNAEIASRLGLHPVSISRILGRALRHRREA